MDIEATQSIAYAVKETDVTFIVVATPSNKDGSYSLTYMLDACKKIGEALKEKGAYHLVVVTSTVMPGDTQGPILRQLEKSSGKKVGQHFGLCYSPEFIAIGSVIHDMLNPDFVLIGASDEQASKILQGIYQRTISEPEFEIMSIQNAELTKIAINTFITTKISYANMIAELCEKYPGGDVDVVTQAIGHDSRIGTKYLKGGPPYAGPCFPRDNRALSKFADDSKVWSAIPIATDSTNNDHKREILYKILDNLKWMQTVGILGLAYKTDTDVTTESLGTYLLTELERRNKKVSVYEPSKGQSMEICIQGSDIVVLTVQYPEILDIPFSTWKGKTVIDPWRMAKSMRYDDSIKYIGIGLGE